MIVHLWADLENSINRLVEGAGKLLGEVLFAEEDDAAVELMSQEVVANVYALGSGAGRPVHQSQVYLVTSLGSRWDFSCRPGCRLETLLGQQAVLGCLPDVRVLDLLEEPGLLSVESARIPEQT